MDNKETILIVDDENSIRESFNLILHDHYNVIMVSSGEAALKKAVDQKIDLAYLDIRMPGMDGLETLRRLKGIDDNIEVMMVTAVNEVQKAVEAIKYGARDYIVKPFDVHKILRMTEDALKNKLISREIKNIHLEGKGKFSKDELVGSTEKIKKIKETIDKVADKDFNILIEGEPGVEKEAISRIIHIHSHRYLRNFIFANIPLNAKEGKLKSQFWGFGKGSSIHSLEKKEGYLEKCSGGTLIINNIDNLPLNFQKSLCEILKKRSYIREGSSEHINFNTRIISLSNKNLQSLVDQGTFDANLYTCISEVKIDIPHLSSRSMDVPPIANYFLEKFNIKHNKQIKGFTKEALDVLTAYKWPGNTDELKSLVEWLVISKTEEFIVVESLPIDILMKSPAYLASGDSKVITYDHAIYKFEKKYIENILKENGNNKSIAAKILGLNLPALSVKLESLDINI